MYNNIITMSYKSIFIINILFCCFIFLSSCNGERAVSKKKITSSNPTYLNINNSSTSGFIDWQGEIFEEIYYRKEKVIQPDYPLQVKLKEPNFKKTKKIITAPLFLLDTTNYSQYGSLAYTENPKYFGELTAQNAHRGSKTLKKIGTYEEELLYLNLEYSDIAYILMQFGIIGTYDHLFAEMIISSQKDMPDFHEIHYNCVYHYCTNNCYDPKYKFSIRFDKSTREISIKPK